MELATMISMSKWSVCWGFPLKLSVSIEKSSQRWVTCKITREDRTRGCRCSLFVVVVVAFFFPSKTNFVLNFWIFSFISQPYQHSGYIPLEAGKYYWIEALHKEGTRRDSLSVGFTLECPNAPSVLSEKPILRPSLQYNIPRKLDPFLCLSLGRWGFFNYPVSFQVNENNKGSNL